MPISWSRIAASAAVVAALATPSPVTAAAAPPRDITEFACPRNLDSPFSDVAGTTHEVSIECLLAFGVVSGTSATTFSPSDRVTRGQLATLIARALALAGVALDTTDAGFIDLGGSVHTDAINALANLGVITGKRPNRFFPDDRATRAQTATIGARTVPDELPAAPPDAFVDDEGATAHELSIDQLAAVGVITGVDAEHFDPERAIGRGAVATIVARILDFTIQQGLVPPPSAAARAVAALTAVETVPGPGEAGVAVSVVLVRGGLPGLLCVEWDVDGPFASAPTAAHVHTAAAGANGPVLLTLPTPVVAAGQRLSSRRCVSDRNERDIETLFANPGAHYVDVETTGQPNGAVRGQLTTATAPLGTMLTGAEHVDGGEAAGFGDATIGVFADGRTICAQVVYDGQERPTAARVHKATVGAAGPAVVTLAPFDEDLPISDGCIGQLDPAVVTDLAADPASYYVSVETDSHPNGAVRGQLARSAILAAALDGAQEVPGPGDGDGRGEAFVDVVGDGLVCFHVSAIAIDRVMAAHIHQGATGVAGPIVVTLSPPTFGNVKDCVDADPAVAADIAANPSQYYVNVHTAVLPNGAIRGQLAPDAG